YTVSEPVLLTRLTASVDAVDVAAVVRSLTPWPCSELITLVATTGAASAASPPTTNFLREITIPPCSRSVGSAPSARGTRPRPGPGVAPGPGQALHQGS